MNLIKSIIQFALMFFTNMLEKNKEKRAKKTELLKEAKDALDKKDNSELNRVFNRIKSL